MKELIQEFNNNGFEVLFFKDDSGYQCEILKNDLYVLSIIAKDIDCLEIAMQDLLIEVQKMISEN